MKKGFNRCWVIGAGAIGSVLAALLCLKKTDEVNLVGESPHARAIDENGLIFEISGSAVQTVPITVVSPRNLPMLHSKDLVLLTQKVPELTTTAKWLKSRCDNDTGIIALQNGMGVGDILSQILERPVDRGLAFFGANSPFPGKVIYYPGKIQMRQSEVTEKFAGVMENSQLLCETGQDFKKVQWLKLAINCIANPLAGILGIANRQIISPLLDPAKKAILGEVREVARAEGVELKTTVQDINRILNQDNVPSMRADLVRGHTTEVDFINGAVVLYAARHDISVPVNSLLVSMVKFMESNRS